MSWRSARAPGTCSLAATSPAALTEGGHDLLLVAGDQPELVAEVDAHPDLTRPGLDRALELLHAFGRPWYSARPAVIGTDREGVLGELGERAIRPWRRWYTRRCPPSRCRSGFGPGPARPGSPPLKLRPPDVA